MKTCYRCKIEKPLDEFHKRSDRPDSRQNRCKKCDYERYLERLAEDPEKVRKVARESARRNRKRQLYGITNEQFDRMAERQSGRCLICDKVPPTREKTKGGLVVDHNHATGKVRGLLCHNCNRALGLFRDDPKILASAIRYLTQDAERV